MYDLLLSTQERMECWNTSTLDEFNNLNYDLLLFPSNIIGTETYIKTSPEKDAQTINGFKLLKKHKKSNSETCYFVRTEDINDLPVIILSTKKINYNKEVYNVVQEVEKCRIESEQKMTWKELIDMSGCPKHTNQIHYSLYKMKCLYGRLKDQFYYRTISESCFGKTKYKEMIKMLLDKCSIISSPSCPKLFFAICHNKDVCCNEMPDLSSSQDFSKFCNILMNIGDKSKSIENPSRKTAGTFEIAQTNKTSMCFTHNVPEYYHKIGKKGFDEIYPYNVINRYYYNLYEGQTEFYQKYGYNAEQCAIKYNEFLKDWIKTALWYEDNWNKIENTYPECLLDGFKFRKDEPRFKEHFIDFAKCIAEYSNGDMNLYVKLLIEEYKSHKKYEEMLQKKENFVTETNMIFTEKKGEI